MDSTDSMVPVTWYAYQDLGSSIASDGPVDAGEAGIDIPDDVLAWAAGHGWDCDNPDVYVLVATEADAPAGPIIGQLAVMDGTVSEADATRITAQLAQERAVREERASERRDQEEWEREVHG